MPTPPAGPPGVHRTGKLLHLHTRPWSPTAAPVDGAAAREPDPTPDTGTEPDPHTELATVIQAMFLAQHRTLTDEDTALAFQLGIDAAQLAVDASLAQGAVSAYGHEKITNILVNMRTAPERL